MEEKNEQNVIELHQLIKKIWEGRRLFYKVLPITFILSCIYIISIPRTYSTEVKMAPETDNTGGGIGSIASSFGFSIGNIQTTDAINPMLYPDLMEDNGFVYSLMNIHVVSQDGEINTNYYRYLKEHQKKTWWSYPIAWLKDLLPKPEDKGGSKGAYDPYNLNKKENSLYEAVRGNVAISIDKKTGVITLRVTSQDPLISRILGDSIQHKLQNFITSYRTNKANIDYQYYLKLVKEAKMEYDKSLQLFANLSDASFHTALQSKAQKVRDAERDMQLKYNTYTTLNTQMQTARAKVQERTPAFTVIKGASVPVKASGPKRMIFVIGMMILVFFFTSLYIVRKELHFNF